ncbi:RING finger protein 219-like [Brachionus plicatilis]|uniref:RING finger protein 219-like n=1 Tax=Brachionus plicatilis TaxID=10195 RepID=A0A3M7RXF7_BRAPC|nr:RING finger protein 219-like [Brachionus plicatilis]
MSARESSSHSGKVKSQSSASTLPITCQICFENVKEPCVCSNLHVFCSFCIDIWLEKNNQCPTCHVQIDENNPYKHLVGGIQDFESSLPKTTEFSNPSIRKARYITMFQHYEDEINRLNNLVASLKEEVIKLKETAKNFDPLNSPQHDMIQLLKKKLQYVQISYNEACQENEGLKEQYKNLENENAMLVQDIAHLKASLSEKSSQLGSKIIAENLQSKIQSYEKEIKFLKKSLGKSEKYIASLKTQRDKETKPNGKYAEETFQSNSSSAFSFVKPSSLTSSLNSAIKNKNDSSSINKSDLKSVKFSERIDKFPSSLGSTGSSNSPKYSTNKNIPNLSNNLKKNLIANSSGNSHDFDANNQLSQSMLIMSNNQLSNFLSSNSSNSFTNQSQNQNFAYSSLKKCRRDEVGLEKPDESTNEKTNKNDNLNASTSEFIDCMEILNRAEKNVQNRQKSPTRPVQNSNLKKNFLHQNESNGLVQMIKSDSSIHSSSSSGNSLSANGASSISSSSPSDSSINLNSLGKKNTSENSKNATFNMKSYSFNSYHPNSKQDVLFKEHGQNLNYNNNGISFTMANRSRTIEPNNRILK